jgi:hypothetical protein
MGRLNALTVGLVVFLEGRILPSLLPSTRHIISALYWQLNVVSMSVTRKKSLCLDESMTEPLCRWLDQLATANSPKIHAWPGEGHIDIPGPSRKSKFKEEKSDLR